MKDDSCDQCGVVYDLSGIATVADDLQRAADVVAQLLVAAPAPRQLPSPEVWSPLQYACHVRDVLLVQRERVLAARRTERPSFAPMGRDERVEHDGYNDQQVADVARQLTDACMLFANVLRRLAPDDWQRTLVYNYPTSQDRSLAWVAMHTLHELRHHAADIAPEDTAGEAALRSIHEQPVPAAPVWWLVEVSVRAEDVPAFEELTHEMVAAAAEEPGTLAYQRYRADATTFHLHERYATAHAAVCHLEAFDRSFADRFSAVVTRRRFHVYGPVTPELHAALERFGASVVPEWEP